MAKHSIGGTTDPETGQEFAEYLASLVDSGEAPIHLLGERLEKLTQLTEARVIEGVELVTQLADEAMSRLGKAEAASVYAGVTTALAAAGEWGVDDGVSPDQWLDEGGAVWNLLRPFLTWGVAEPNLAHERRVGLILERLGNEESPVGDSSADNPRWWQEQG